jgi:tRNA threonylcarbamoyl adenosine modification protein (Sua5/YciO/YrdC/YwlC family)
VNGPLTDARAAVDRGGLIVFPTDTVYGIGCRPDDATAIGRLFEVKERPRDLILPVLAASTAAARAIARFDDRAERLALALWPGALTLVLPRTPGSATWQLGGGDATIGVRVPDHPMALALLAAGPLATTSANRSGEPPGTTCDELVDVFGEGVDVYLCQDDALVGAASTVVSLVGALEILRVGALDPTDIERLSAG